MASKSRATFPNGSVEFAVRIAQRRHHPFTNDRFRSLPRVHRAGDEVMLPWVDVRRDGVAVQSLRFDQLAVEPRQREPHLMPASLERLSETDVREHVAEGTPACDDDPTRHG